MFDSSVWHAILLVATIGGIIGLDRTAAGQFMVSQPIVAAPLTGWILGEPDTGLVIGTALELVWVLDIPVGKFVPADATICAVSATAVAVLGSAAHPTVSTIGLAILTTIVMVPLTMRSDALVRTWNSRLYDRVWKASGKGLAKALTQAQAAGLLLFFLRSFVLYCLFIPAGIVVMRIGAGLLGTDSTALSLFVRLLPLLGMAVIVRRLSMRTLNAHFLIAFASAAVLMQIGNVPVLAMLLIAAGVGWYGGALLEKGA